MIRSGMPVPYVQYSKRLCSVITGFWCALRLLGLVALILRPALAQGMQGILQGADDVMMCNVAFYCGNSVAEKGIVHYFDSRADKPGGDAGETVSPQNG